MKPYKFQRVRIRRQLSMIPKTVYCPDRFPATARQTAAYRIIKARIEACGIAPSRRELAKMMGLKSVSGTQLIIKGLVERGLIEILPQRPRAIRMREKS